MRKASSENGVGLRVVQIPLPLEWGSSSDAASHAEDDRDSPSSAAGPTGEREQRKRKWYSLYDKVYAPKNLETAWDKVRSNKGSSGCDGQTLAQFEERLDENLGSLHQELREKRYRPRPVKRVLIAKSGGGQRPLGIPTVRDRIVQQAALQILGPIFERKFSERSHGFRPERGCQTALGVIDQALRNGYEWVVDADIQRFFDSVDHEVLLDAVHEEVTDGSVLRLLRMFLESGALQGPGEFEPTEVGTPQGGPISPLLANIYLHRLDVSMEAAGFGLVRYADDFVILTRDRGRAEEALELATEVLHSLKLHLHPEKTHIAAIDEGFDFLGYRYFRSKSGVLQKELGRRARTRFREAIRKRTPRHSGQKRRRAKHCTLQRLRKSQSLQETIQELNVYLRGWLAYFRGVQTSFGGHFGALDGFVRRRLRSHIAGRYAKGCWHSILPNALLADLGLYGLQAHGPAPRPYGLRRSPLQANPSPPNSGYPSGSRMR